MPWTVLIVAVVALIASIMVMVGGVSSWMGGPAPTTPGPYGMPMMPGQGGMMPGTPGTGPVGDLTEAGRAAQRFADERGLHTGEVMRFSNGYYAEVLDPGGNGATEVLIDPGSGSVQLEWGPAMMWNTTYGMMPSRPQTGATLVGPAEATRIADQWLQQSGTGLHAAEPTAFPGYYTLHSLRDDKIVGMLSVNAATGDVWYHTWHGQFIQMQETPHGAETPR
ncbi:hypothetical protein [Saccharopolyspora phatthalungensis]|uniref:hypothetical protein n=1 Tax=Saccharopolyspora phatthalungensis TaxID=664693 RepID=UPI000AD0E377|nr:hypothetical protein [Saccharopolyspora phatthalungensis]